MGVKWVECSGEKAIEVNMKWVDYEKIVQLLYIVTNEFSQWKSNINAINELLFVQNLENSWLW